MAAVAAAAVAPPRSSARACAARRATAIPSGTPRPRRPPLNPSNPPNPSNLSNRAPLSASSTAAALPAGLRSLQGRLPALLQARLAASRQHGGAAGRVSPSGRWHTVVCEGALFVWAASANHASTSAPPLLATIDLPDTQSVDADQLGRLCVLENDASPSNTAAPTMLYVTPWGEVQCWHMIGRADSADANGRLPDLATGKTLSLSPLCVSPLYVSIRLFSLKLRYQSCSPSIIHGPPFSNFILLHKHRSSCIIHRSPILSGEVCLALTGASSSVGLCLMSSGRVICVAVNWQAAARTSTLSFREVVGPRTASTGDSASATAAAGSGFFGSWFGGNGGDGESSTSSSPPTSSGSRHPGALAVRMSPGGQDNTLECCIVRSAGPDRPGVIILECVQLHAVSGVAVGSPQQTRVQTSLSGSGTIDPIAAAYAHEVDAIVVLVACDVPSSFSLLQISIPPGPAPAGEQSLARATAASRRITALHPPWCVVLPVAPVWARH